MAKVDYSLAAGAEREAQRNAFQGPLGDVLGRLALYPHDTFLQFKALQLARREDKLAEVEKAVDELAIGSSSWAMRSDRREDVDLFNLFSGALAVQESLQLDAMRATPVGPGEPTAASSTVPITTLHGPEVESHPWEKMLAGRTPGIPALAKLVPDDFYLAEFRSLTRLLDAADEADQWSTHVFSQTWHEARSHRAGERVRRQLAIETDPLARPFYDLVVEDVAVAGSDLFLREGADVTLLFRVKQPQVFKVRMDGFLADAEKSRPDAKRSAGECLGVAYAHVATPDRDICVYSAYPSPDLHVRSNSKSALERILGAIRGTGADGKTVRKLGDSPEYAYIRTLMPMGAPEEDGFIYLSDPFIRRLVGPELKLTERRRMLCYNHLRLIGHASLLYRTENGKVADSLATLDKARCTPGTSGQGDLACPDGGAYALLPDGSGGVCSRHGTARFLTPCCEIPVTTAAEAEAQAYKAFVEQYNQYWRMYFDPIALRVRITSQRFRLETIILPLIDNSIYTGMAKVLGGKPELLDSAPVPDRNIFTLAVRLNKDAIREEAAGEGRDLGSAIFRSLDLGGAASDLPDIDEFIEKGLGNQVALHVCDAAPMFDFNLMSFLGQAAGTVSGRRMMGGEMIPITLLISALNSPVYLTATVQDEKVVDGFLDRLDSLLAALARRRQGGGWFEVEQDFARVQPVGRHAIRGYGLRFGPLKWRFFWARIGKTLAVASKPIILQDLVDAVGQPRPVDPAPEPAHAMLRIRPQHWKDVLPDYRLGWAENNREACLDNLGPLTNVLPARPIVLTSGPAPSPEKIGSDAHALADRLYGVHFYCPEGGSYVTTADGKEIACSVHGTASAPTQPAEGSGLRDFTGLTAALTFDADGLRAVLTVDRKPYREIK